MLSVFGVADDPTSVTSPDGGLDDMYHVLGITSVSWSRVNAKEKRHLGNDAIKFTCRNRLAVE